MNKALILLIIIHSASGEKVEVPQTDYEACQVTAEEITDFVQGYTAECPMSITPPRKDG